MNTNDAYVDRIRASLARQAERSRSPGPMESLLQQHYRAEAAERARASRERAAEDSPAWEEIAARLDVPRRFREALARQDALRSGLISDEPITPPAKPTWIEATISNAVAQHPDRPRFLGAELILDETLPPDVVDIVGANGQRIRIEVAP